MRITVYATYALIFSLFLLRMFVSSIDSRKLEWGDEEVTREEMHRMGWLRVNKWV